MGINLMPYFKQYPRMDQVWSRITCTVLTFSACLIFQLRQNVYYILFIAVRSDSGSWIKTVLVHDYYLCLVNSDNGGDSLVLHHILSVIFLKPTVLTRPSVPPSGSHKCPRYGLWSTLCTIKYFICLLDTIFARCVSVCVSVCNQTNGQHY